MEVKTCTKCHRTKNVVHFGVRKASPDGLMAKCKTCVSKANAEYKKKKPEAQRTSHLKIKYNLTPEEYLQLDTLQEGKCLICGRHKSDFGIELAVDHNHVTGKTRGLLCINCNNGLGKFHDDPNLLDKASEYLRRYDDLK